MTALIDTIFPGSEYDNCLHLDLDSSKKTNDITIVKNCESIHAISACSDSCNNEMFSMITSDVPLCVKCASNTDNIYALSYGGKNYKIRVCPACQDNIIASLRELNKTIECDGCGKQTKSRCACLRVGYCSKECQIKKRPTHKLECKPKPIQTV